MKRCLPLEKAKDLLRVSASVQSQAKLIDNTLTPCLTQDHLE